MTKETSPNIPCWFLSLLIGGMTAACFNPTIREGLPCSEANNCPAGQTCDPVDQRCYVTLPNRDASMGGDGAIDGNNTIDSGVEPDAAVDAAPPPPCMNETMDGLETDIDCGGSDCPPCMAGEMCAIGADCDSQICGGDMRCTMAMCGDGVVNSMAEECDEGVNNSDTNPDACRTTCLMASCGDGVVDTGEEVDPPPGPSTSVPVDPVTCRYDFSGIRQLFCNGACGNWGGGNGCQQQDADALCKLVTDNPASFANNFTVVTALSTSGICCPPPTFNPGDAGCIPLGDMTARGVPLSVSVHDTNLFMSHGPDNVVRITQISDCADP